MPRRAFAAWLAGLAAAGLALRLTVFVTEHRGARFGFNDGPYYSQQAFELARGVLFRDPTGGPGAEHGPLTAVLLAPFSWADSVDLQKVGTIVLGTATIVVLGLVGRRLGGPRVGLLAAGVAALYPNLWVNDGLVMSESPGALFVSLWLLAGLVWLERRDTAAAVTWGVLGGLGALTRSELGLLIVLSAVVMVVVRRPDRWRSAAVVVAAAVVVMAPWLAWNATRFERPVLLTTNDGTTLRGANCDDTYAGDALGSWSLDCLVLDDGAALQLDPSRRAARWRSEGLAYIGDNLDRIPVVVLARAGRMLDVHGLGHMVDEDVRDDRPRWASWAGIVAWWLLAPAAAYGVLRTPAPARWLLLSPAIVVLVTSLLFYGGHRIRSPLEPVVVLGAGLALAGRRRVRPS